MQTDAYWDVAQAAATMRATAERLREEAERLDNAAGQIEMNAGQFGEDFIKRLESLEKRG